MDQQHRHTRNQTREFARRTRRNLEFIEAAAAQHEDVHVVTQLTLSLLGLIVFPTEKDGKHHLLPAIKKTLTAMASEGWPTWTITRDEGKLPTTTLADLLRHLRNAVAHGRLTFTSDSPQVEEVAIIVQDQRKATDPEPNWCAHIEMKDLRLFCLRFLDFIEDTVE